MIFTSPLWSKTSEEIRHPLSKLVTSIESSQLLKLLNFWCCSPWLFLISRPLLNLSHILEQCFWVCVHSFINGPKRKFTSLEHRLHFVYISFGSYYFDKHTGVCSHSLIFNIGGEEIVKSLLEVTNHKHNCLTMHITETPCCWSAQRSDSQTQSHTCKHGVRGMWECACVTFTS